MLCHFVQLGSNRARGWVRGHRPLNYVLDRLRGGDVIVANNLAAAFRDAFPLSEDTASSFHGFTLADFLALTQEELAAIWIVWCRQCGSTSRRNQRGRYNIASMLARLLARGWPRPVFT